MQPIIPNLRGLEFFLLLRMTLSDTQISHRTEGAEILLLSGIT